MEKVYVSLTNEGYHPCSYRRKNNGFFGPRTGRRITIERLAEVERFIKEIGTEKSETQKRFNQFLTGRINKELISVGGMPGETRANVLVLVPPPVAALGIIGQVASRLGARSS